MEINLKQATCLGISSLLLLSGCSTRAPSEKIFNEDNPYQTPNFSVSSYKSPEKRSTSQRRDVAVAVAISGGGHRAGNFGIGVLKELEKFQCNQKTFNILNEIDYFSTVSGGGLAAGLYLSTLHDHIKPPIHTHNSYSLSNLINQNTDNSSHNLERGYHNTLTRALVSVKALGNNDRGDFLEKEFDEKILGADKRNRSLRLKDIFLDKDNTQEPKLPLWVANATIYENGSIFPFHPEALRQYQVTEYTHHLEKYEINEDYYSLPLAVGLKASASFPGAVPATTLKSSTDSVNPFIHLFDGGLSDNLGVYSALQMLGDSDQNTKVLIVIDAYNGQPEPFSKQEGSPTIFQIFLRTTSISLDAWRIRHKALIEQLSTSNAFNGNKIKVVYLSFDHLPRKLKAQVLNIGTNFNISPAAQQTIFQAAKHRVNDKGSAIVKAIWGVDC
ncbi:patatin-like phospholipase family protein [Neptuniibacter sp. SY11_33]|uniref:patatin-like phospholipase family protein n=1 Tax=Neptuniibacter sp. SY11_33 TaxID=3398215 RepID=UPI0039F45509